METSMQIAKTSQTMEERGLPPDSYFEVTFADGSVANEKDTNWSSISEKVEVEYFGVRKTVHLCRFPVKYIEAWYEGLHASIEVPEGSRAYQSIRGETTIVPNVQRIDRTVGRFIGVVKDGEVVEEQFLDGVQFEVRGMKK